MDKDKDIFMAAGRGRKAFGNLKKDPSFIESFLNDSYMFTDLRYIAESHTVFEQSTPVKFDIKNNEIAIGSIASEGDLLNVMHAISVYYDLMLPKLKSGFVKNLEIYDASGNIQSIPKPKIRFDKTLNPVNNVYLDHPERICSDIGGIGYAFYPEGASKDVDFPTIINKEDIELYEKEGGNDSLKPRTIQQLEYLKSQRSILRKFEKNDVDAFKNFNQGTDFIFLNNNVTSLENLIGEYNSALQKKAGFVIAELLGKYKRHIGDSGRNTVVYDHYINDNLSGAVLKAPLEECVKLAERAYALNKRYYSDFGFPFMDLPKEMNTETLTEYVKKQFLDTQAIDIDYLEFIPYLEKETIKDYLNRLYRLSDHDNNTSRVMHNCLRNTFGYGADMLPLIEKPIDEELATEIYSCLRYVDVLPKIVEGASQMQKDMLEKIISGKTLPGIVNWGLENLSDSMLWIIQEHPDLFKDMLSGECSKTFQESLKNNYFDGDKYDHDSYGGLRPFGYWIKNYPFLKDAFSDVYEKAVRIDTLESLRGLGEIDGDYYTEKTYVLKSWLKEVRKQKTELMKENNKAMKEEIPFTSQKLSKISMNKSFFVVPTFILHFKNKQYNRFIEQLDEYDIPYNHGEDSIFIYDMRRTKAYRRERIPEKLRNEFRINPYSTDKQAIGVRRYATSNGAEKEQKVSYFANIDLLIRKSSE